jgi:hypothetical protein
MLYRWSDKPDSSVVVIYLFQAIWGLKHLDFNGYNKIQPDIAHFETHLASFGTFWTFRMAMRRLGVPKLIFFTLCV